MDKYGYICYPEISRAIIKQQQLSNGNKTPWQDISGFVNLNIPLFIEQLSNPNTNTITFTDRGFPDLIAYLHSQKLTSPPILQNFNFKQHYHTNVFFLPTWSNIYTTDPQRQQTYTQALAIEKALIDIYTSLGFNILIVPKTTLTKRLEFIQSFI